MFINDNQRFRPCSSISLRTDFIVTMSTNQELSSANEADKACIEDEDDWDDDNGDEGWDEAEISDESNNHNSIA